MWDDLGSQNVLGMGSATASGVLTQEEFERFAEDFVELEASRFTKVIVEEIDDTVLVILSTDSVAGFLLRASLHDGLLHHLGWDKKFQIIN